MTPGHVDEQGFRIRGAQPTRIDAFVDAAFAFAVTLLVVAVGHMPTSAAELGQAMRGVPAFVAGFLLLSRLWLAHRHWSRRYGIEDATSARLSLALVFVMLVYVHPLRMVAELVLGLLSGGAFVEQRIEIRSAAEMRLVYVTFALGYAVACALFALLYRHALLNADALGLDAGERIRTQRSIERYLLFAGIGTLSLLLALPLPIPASASSWFYAAPGLVYLLILPGGRWLAHRERRALARIGASA